ncbi:MAG: hypothetical protein JW927_06240 [Deltaproteobacteria bacterium]|nr:hypothetical protein [Deltaproteobacteria bacterium]
MDFRVEGQEMDCNGTIQAWIYSGYYNPGDCSCVGGNPVCKGSSSGGGGSGKKYNPEQDMRMMVVGTIFESLLTSIFMDNSARDKAELEARQKAQALAMQQALQLEKERAALAQAEYDKMMQLYKRLDSGRGVAYKTLSNTALSYKGLDDDLESMAADAREPFDTASDDVNDSGSITTGGGTGFFGDTMPIEQIELLVNPENNPNVVDLRDAVEYVAKNIKDENQRPVEDKNTEKSEPEKVLKPECRDLPQRLNSYIEQRAKFQKTIEMAQVELTTWQTANRNALLNAAKDGLEVFVGDLLEGFTKRAKAAERIKRILEKNVGQMAKDGVNVTEIQAKIERLKILSSAGKSIETAGSIKDWQVFIKDGLSGLMEQLTSSNQEIKKILEEPMIQKYLETDTPELKAMLDISRIAASANVFGKWVAKRMPIIAGIELAINQLYNATDWYLSYRNLAEAHKINGKIMDSARYIQKNIDDTYMALSQCN